MLSLDRYKILLCELLSYDRCVMTPNLMEMKRLTDALLSSSLSPSSNSLHKFHNSNIIVQKGVIDTIINDVCTLQCEEEGGV